MNPNRRDCIGETAEPLLRSSPRSTSRRAIGKQARDARREPTGAARTGSGHRHGDGRCGARCGQRGRCAAKPALIRIKLKGVEISDCDSVVIEGNVARPSARHWRCARHTPRTANIMRKSTEFAGDLTVRTRLVIHGTGRVSGNTIRYGRRRRRGDHGTYGGATRPTSARPPVRGRWGRERGRVGVAVTTGGGARGPRAVERTLVQLTRTPRPDGRRRGTPAGAGTGGCGMGSRFASRRRGQGDPAPRAIVRRHRSEPGCAFACCTTSCVRRVARSVPSGGSAVGLGRAQASPARAVDSASGAAVLATPPIAAFLGVPRCLPRRPT
jgi:hypothetical protein